jgi:hypothetical protein
VRVVAYAALAQRVKSVLETQDSSQECLTVTAQAAQAASGAFAVAPKASGAASPTTQLAGPVALVIQAVLTYSNIIHLDYSLNALHV